VKTHPFKSPFEHWLSGLIAEITMLGGFLLAVWLMALAIMWVWQG
jgi:hypothetical protein